jgi:hypothetical protein
VLGFFFVALRDEQNSEGIGKNLAGDALESGVAVWVTVICLEEFTLVHTLLDTILVNERAERAELVSSLGQSS